MKNFYAILLIASVAIFSTNTQAQLAVTNDLTVEEYIQDVLLGSGVEVSNITWNDGPANVQTPQVGSFNSQFANVGIESGLIMSCGDVAEAVGPNDTGGATGVTGADNFGSNDPDLISIMSPDTPNDWAIIEFDFIPNGDTIRFSYVFASEEYPEYVDSFNDGFGFFLSGPGINGPYSNNADNIAVIPGTDIPVTINNLNNGNDGINGPCDYCEFYVHNGTGGDPEWDPDNEPYWGIDSLIQYDGFTVPLEAFAIVECGETYHIKLAIADANDTALDSAVFLQEGSFASSAAVNAELEIANANIEGVMYESCGSATLIFSRLSANSEDEVFISVGGTATMGVDYTVIPESIIFPEGVFQVSIPIEAFEDGIPEGPESVILDMENVAQCSGTTVQTNFQFFITEPEPFILTPNEFTACSGVTTPIFPLIDGGTGFFDYEWSTGETSDSLFVNVSATTSFNVLVTDSCTGLFNDVDVTVNVIPNTLDGNIITQDFFIGCFDDVSIEGTSSGGFEFVDFFWTDQDGNVLSQDENFTYSDGGGGEINLTLVDGCGATITDQIIATPLNPLSIDAGPDLIVNCDDLVPISVSVSGGEAPFTYSWTVNDIEVGSSQEINYPAQEVTISVEVNDGCGNTVTDALAISFQEYPINVSLPADLVICFGEDATISGVASGGYGALSYQWNNEMGTNPTIEVDPQQLTNYILVASDVCGNVGSDDILVDIFSMISDFAFGFEEDDVAQFIPYTDPVCNGCEFVWDFGDGSMSDENQPLHEFDGLQEYLTTLYITTPDGCIDSVQHIVPPSPQVFIPTAFTPNNDGLNDVFQVFGKGLLKYEFTIYNRWGQAVFRSDDLNDYWMGDTDESGQYYVHSGVYTYRCVYRGYNTDALELSGTISVLR